MTDPITPPALPTAAELAELRRLADNATLGRWWNAGTDGPPHGPYTGYIIDSEAVGDIAAVVYSPANADYIAAANPATMQRLLALIDAQHAALRELQYVAAVADSSSVCWHCHERPHRPGCRFSAAMAGSRELTAAEGVALIDGGTHHG